MSPQRPGTRLPQMEVERGQQESQRWALRSQDGCGMSRVQQLKARRIDGKVIIKVIPEFNFHRDIYMYL